MLPGETSNDSGSDRQHGQRSAQMARKVKRKLSARRAGPPRILGGLGLFGLVGWSVAVPTLIGVVVGWRIDHLWPGNFSWALALLFAGVALGCANAWYWIQRESQRDSQQEDKS